MLPTKWSAALAHSVVTVMAVFRAGFWCVVMLFADFFMLGWAEMVAPRSDIPRCLTRQPSPSLMHGLKKMHKRDVDNGYTDVLPETISVDMHVHIVLAENERENGRVKDHMVLDQVRLQSYCYQPTHWQQ